MPALNAWREAERHDAIAEDDRVLLTAMAVDGVDHVRDFALGHQLVDDFEGDDRTLRQHLTQHDATRRGVIDLLRRLAIRTDAVPAIPDLGMQRDRLLRQRMLDLGDVAEHLALPRLVVAHQREIIETEHDILRRHDDRLTVGRMQDVVGRHHQHARFQLRFERQRNVHGHLVAVEVGVERGADQRMKLDRLAFDQHRLERLNAETMQRRRAVQQHRMFADDLVEDIPDFGLFLFDQLLRAA